MAEFNREYLRNTAKECGIELPKEFEDGLIERHLSARNAYSENQVNKALKNHKPENPADPKESEEYKALQSEFDTFKTSVAEEKANGIKVTACVKALTDLGINEKTARLLVNAKDFDLAKIELDGEKFKNADEVSKTFKEAYADFIPETHKEGANTENPPKNEGGAITLEQFNKMTYAERDKLYSENHTLYEQLRDSAKEN